MSEDAGKHHKLVVNQVGATAFCVTVSNMSGGRTRTERDGKRCGWGKGQPGKDRQQRDVKLFSETNLVEGPRPVTVLTVSGMKDKLERKDKLEISGRKASDKLETRQ